jgi:SpoVK/Ycf46/Vps4 family AAA+-type ATPase
MATAEQLKALIRSHFGGNAEHFMTAALQVAAHEARQGHCSLAHDIRELIDRARKNRSRGNILPMPQDLSGLVFTEEPSVPLAALVVSRSLRERIKRVVLEFRQQGKLKNHGLSHRRKVLLSGAPGTGKTMTARVLATELRQSLHFIQMDRLVTKFMGETGAKLRLIFDRMRTVPGVYLFDEFDAIGGERDFENDVGEMRRVLNAFLQFIENDTSDNLIVAATNNRRLLDRALFRRFDDVLHYALPSPEERSRLIANLLGTFRGQQFPLAKAAKAAERLSQAEIAAACLDATKQAILANKDQVTLREIQTRLKERHEAYSRKKR